MLPFIIKPMFCFQRLISVEHCFEDNLVPLPALPPLLTKTEPDDQSEKDNLIDELIDQKYIPDFTPERGYVNPIVTMLRDIVASKMLRKSGQVHSSTNRVDMIREKGVEPELLERLKVAFPLESQEAEATQIIAENEFVTQQVNNEFFSGEIKQECAELSKGYAGIKHEMREAHDGDQQVVQEDVDLIIKQEFAEDVQAMKGEFDSFVCGDE